MPLTPLPPVRRGALLRTALACSVLGIVDIVAVYLVAAASSSDPPLVLYLLSLLLPLGMVLAAVAVAKDYRRPR